jgi:hypothetical protein
MKTDILATAVALPDRDLLARMPILAAHERTATAELVAHLAALRLRPSLYAAEGYGSLFAYCRQALRLSEDAASNRIHAAKACMKFPVILDLLVSGELSLSAVRMLRPHLTIENYAQVLARARNGRRIDIERLVAELTPRPDVPSSVRKLPRPGGARPQPPAGEQGTLPATEISVPVTPTAVQPGSAENETRPSSDVESAPVSPAQVDLERPAAHSVPRPVVQPLSPERYRVQFTVGQEAYDILQRLQTLLRRELPDGDAGAIFERGLRLLHEEVEAARFGRTRGIDKHNGGGGSPKVARESQVRAVRNPDYESRIRPGADSGSRSRPRRSGGAEAKRKRVKTPGSRYIPQAVKRAVWYRDRGQCAFVSAAGRRCGEREFLELHHIQPYALRGPSTARNIALRCRRHNAYEAEVVFGTRSVLARVSSSG